MSNFNSTCCAARPELYRLWPLIERNSEACPPATTFPTCSLNLPHRLSLMKSVSLSVSITWSGRLRPGDVSRGSELLDQSRMWE